MAGRHVRPLVQIVGYDSGVGHIRFDPVDGVQGDPEPATLLVATDGRVQRYPLAAGQDLSFTLGDRHCAGSHDGEIHDPCPAPSAPRCDVHTSAWPCARCSGQCDLPIDACREEHAVYLAAFAPDKFKIGVTRLWRLHARLREQGADRAAHLETVSNGRIARRLERELAANLTDQVRTASKVASLPHEVDDRQWKATLADHDPISEWSFEYGFDLAERPMAETLATGTVVGTQGRLLVLDRGGTGYAVDIRDLVGYEVVPEETDRELQSSLRSFG